MSCLLSSPICRAMATVISCPIDFDLFADIIVEIKKKHLEEVICKNFQFIKLFYFVFFFCFKKLQYVGNKY